MGYTIERSLHFAENEGMHGDAIQLILNRDCEPLKAGSLFLRVSPWLLRLLEGWRSERHPDPHHRTEEGVLRDILLDNVLEIANSSIVMQQTLFHAYPEELNQSPNDG